MQNFLFLRLGTVKELLVTSTPYKCSAAKKIIAGVGNKGIKGNALRQDYLMLQMDIQLCQYLTSQIDELFLNSSLLTTQNF